MILKKKDHFFQKSLLDAGGSKQNQTGNLEIKAYFKMKDLFSSSPGVKAGMNLSLLLPRKCLKWNKQFSDLMAIPMAIGEDLAH